MTGRVYLEHGRPITVLARGAATGPPPRPRWLHWQHPPRQAPRNALIRRHDGELVIRPFRGLRHPTGTQPPDDH